MLKLLKLTLICSSLIGCTLNEPVVPKATREDYVNLIGKGVVYLRDYDTKLFINATADPHLLQKAEAVFSLAGDLRSMDPEAVDGLGSIQVRRGKLDIAKGFFLESLSRDSNYSRAYVHLAYIEEKLGNIAVSKELLGRAQLLSPADTHTLNNLGGIVYDSSLTEEDKDVGRRMLMQAIELGDKKNYALEHNKRILEKE